MTIVVGLGNPGQEYAQTRHNVGWMVVDELLAKHPTGWKYSTRPDWGAEIWVQPDLLLVKPQTYMNDSGRAVQAAARFYKVTSDQVYVIHDDLDIPLGKYKVQLGTGPKVHNGLVSIDQHLGTEDYWHVRVGVDNRQGDRSMPGSAYVLQQFAQGEQEQVRLTVTTVADELWSRVRMH